MFVTPPEISLVTVFSMIIVAYSKGCLLLKSITLPEIIIEFEVFNF